MEETKKNLQHPEADYDRLIEHRPSYNFPHAVGASGLNHGTF